MRSHRSLLTASVMLVALLAQFGCQSQTEKTSPDAEVLGPGQWVGTGQQRLRAEVHASPQLSAHLTLLLVLHGDTPFNKPDYQYTLARRVAQANPDVVTRPATTPGGW